MKRLVLLLWVLVCALGIFSGCDRGLQYELDGGGEYYIVTGRAGEAQKHVVIEGEHKGLPVGEIADSAFENCQTLDSVTISGNIKRIGERAFYGCKNLQNLEIEEGVKEIGGQALGKGYLKIGKYAFSDCDSLTKVFMSKSLKEIEEGAFYDCDRLADVNLSYVEEIGADAFLGCNSLMHINVGEMNPNYQSPDGVLYNGDESILVRYPQSYGQETYSIGFEVVEIGERAFSEADFKRIEICNGVLEKIGAYAFEGCQRMQSIVIGESVRNLGVGCFSGCESLQTVIFNSLEGWTAVKKNEAGGIIECKEMRKAELSDPVSAKELVHTYGEYEWIRNEKEAK